MLNSTGKRDWSQKYLPPIRKHSIITSWKGRVDTYTLLNCENTYFPEWRWMTAFEINSSRLFKMFSFFLRNLELKHLLSKTNRLTQYFPFLWQVVLACQAYLTNLFDVLFKFVMNHILALYFVIIIIIIVIIIIIIIIKTYIWDPLITKWFFSLQHESKNENAWSI